MKIIKHIGECEGLDEEYLINIRGDRKYLFIWRSFKKYKKHIYGYSEYSKERRYTWFEFKNFMFFTY